MNAIQKTSWKILPVELRDKKFKLLAGALVDGEEWFTIQCTPEVSNWIRTQPGEYTLWFQNIDDKWMINGNVFDIHHTFYTMTALRWS